MNTLCNTFCTISCSKHSDHKHSDHKHSDHKHSEKYSNSKISEMELEEDTIYDYSEEAEQEQEEEEEEEEAEEQEESNLEELQRLYNEATQLLINNTPPSEGWYDDHFKYIYKYSELDWRSLAERFRNRDNIMFGLATTINLYIEELMEEYGGKPDFDFNKYYTVICNIMNIWNYYSEKYMGEETDQDIMDLIDGIAGL